MPRFRKLPVEIDAIQWTGKNIIDVMAFMAPQEPVYVNNLSHMKFTNADDVVGIQTLEGLMVANLNDWIIKGVAGELYPCKPDIFAATYEAAPTTTTGAMTDYTPSPALVCELGTELMLDAVREIDYMGIAERYFDDNRCSGLDEEQLEALQDAIADFVSKATITVTAPATTDSRS